MSKIELARLTQVHARHAIVELNGQGLSVCTALVPDVEVGDRVIIHKGFIVKRLEDPSTLTDPGPAPEEHPDTAS